jgi:hypothetical protein
MNPTQPLTESVSNVINRRSFLRRALATGAGAALIPVALSLSADAQTEGLSAANEQDYYVLNFALMLEYLEAEFYNLATKGKTLSEIGVARGGFGTLGTTKRKAGSTIVPFITTGDAVAQYAEEITTDETNHVKFLRAAMEGAGLKPAAAPDLNLVDSFNDLAVAAGIGSSFDPFASELDFLLGGFIFEDVGVTAYHGAAALISNSTYLTAAAGILAVEAYHASLLRTLIYQSGSTGRQLAGKISKTRASLGGGKDQGVLGSVGQANIVPTDANAIAYARTVRQVMNIAFGAIGASKGLFFPSGMNLPSL